MFALLAVMVSFFVGGQPLDSLPTEVILRTAIKYNKGFLDLHNGDTSKAVAYLNK